MSINTIIYKKAFDFHCHFRNCHFRTPFFTKCTYHRKRATKVHLEVRDQISQNQNTKNTLMLLSGGSQENKKKHKWISNRRMIGHVEEINVLVVTLQDFILYTRAWFTSNPPTFLNRPKWLSSLYVIPISSSSSWVLSPSGLDCLVVGRSSAVGGAAIISLRDE